MKPDLEASSLLPLIRQQLILAQVRIMELEDTRDELIPRLSQTSELLRQAQLLADQKIDESAHLTTVQATLQSEFQHLRHVQHITHEALSLNREELARTKENLAELMKEKGRQAELYRILENNLNRVSVNFAQTSDQLASCENRLEQVDMEIRLMKASRSWRWTQALRTVERWFTKRYTP